LQLIGQLPRAYPDRGGEDIIVSILKRHGIAGGRLQTVRRWREAFQEEGLNADDNYAASVSATGGPDAVKYLELKKLLQCVPPNLLRIRVHRR
jgi:hypothetical protein